MVGGKILFKPLKNNIRKLNQTLTMPHTHVVGAY